MSAPAPTSPPAASSKLTAAELGAWGGFLRVHAALLASLDGELEQRHGLPLTSYEVLLTLAASPDRRVRMSELAESVLLSRSGCTRLVDRLERDGLVERRECPVDARGSLAVLTDQGLARFRDAQGTHLAGVRERFTDRFSEEELEQLGILWERVEPGAVSAELRSGQR